MGGSLAMMKELTDPRARNALRHSLSELLHAAFAAMLCGAQSCAEMFSRLFRVRDLDAFEEWFTRLMVAFAVATIWSHGEGQIGGTRQGSDTVHFRSRGSTRTALWRRTSARRTYRSCTSWISMRSKASPPKNWRGTSATWRTRAASSCAICSFSFLRIALRSRSTSSEAYNSSRIYT